MRYSFQGLGGTGNPFAGTIATSSPKPIRTARALFNYLTTTATLPATVNRLKFDIQEQAVNGPVLAQNIEGDGDATWKIGLSGSASIGGIIGTMTGGTVTLEAVLSDWTKETDGYLGLFAQIGDDARIQDVTVNGTVNMSVLNGTDGNANENPLRVAGLVARQAGSVSYNAVTANAAVTVDTDVTNTPYVMQAGMVAFCDENSTLNFTNCNWTSTLTNSRTNSNDRSGGFLAHTKGGHYSDGGELHIIRQY